MSSNRLGPGAQRLPASTQSILAEHAAAIRALGRQTIENVVEIGHRLSECRAILKEDGRWRAWLEDELRSSPQTAGRFIQVYELSQGRSKLEHLDLPVSAIYLLAAPNTPKEARDEIIERAQAGEPVSVAEVKQTIETAKGRAQPARKPKPRDDIGLDSVSEVERLQRQVDELQAEKRRLEIENLELRSEIEDVRKPEGGGSANLLQRVWDQASYGARMVFKARNGLVAVEPPADDGIPPFLHRTAP